MGVLYSKQASKLRPSHSHLSLQGCSSSSVLPHLVLAGRAPAAAWGMSTQAACLLLSKLAPATARLFVEFRRLRKSLTPAERRQVAECSSLFVDADMMAEVRAPLLLQGPHGRRAGAAASVLCAAAGERGTVDHRESSCASQANRLTTFPQFMPVGCFVGAGVWGYHMDQIAAWSGAAPDA